MAEEKFGRWATATTEELPKDLTATVEHLRKLASTRLEREKRLIRLYNPDPSGNMTDRVAWLKRDWPKFNIVRQCVDTMLALVASERYMPRYVVTDGSFDLARVAALRSRVLEGQVEDLKIAAEMYMAALDAYVLGTGHLIGYLDLDGKPKVEAMPPGEPFIDPRSCVRGKPTRYFRHRAVPLEWLLDQYPDVPAHLIENSAKPTSRDQTLLDLPRDPTVEEIVVSEGWTAPQGEGKPGRHAIVTSRVTLVEEDWARPIPIIPLYYQKRQLGYWGIGIGEILQDEQARSERLLNRADACHEIDSTVYIIPSTHQQRIWAEQVQGAPARILRHAGAPNPPSLHSFRGTGDVLDREFDRIRERALSILGISQLDAENKKPAGITSAPGQRTFADLSARRQRQVSDNAKETWSGIFDLLEHLNAQAQELDGGYSIAARTTRGLVPLTKTVKWSDAKLPPEQYRLSLQLISDVPYQVGSRIEQIQEWIKSGFSRRDFAQKQVMTTPNDDFQRRETADLDYACWMVEEVLDGRDVELDPYLRPEIAFDVFRTSYLPVKSDGAPEEILAKLRGLIQQSLEAIEMKKAIPGPVDPTGGNYRPTEALQLPGLPQPGLPQPQSSPVMPGESLS